MYVCMFSFMHVFVRVISQMIAFCALPRKYAKLRCQRLPPFWIQLAVENRKKRKKCTLFFPRNAYRIRSIRVTRLINTSNSEKIRILRILRILSVEGIGKYCMLSSFPRYRIPRGSICLCQELDKYCER